MPYLPGLDGLRALAVLAVVVYHANHTWLEGGYLGVEVFFVISGYLITLLLLGEHERNRRIDLSDFWLREADLPVRIPMAGQADSLNVAMAAIITLFEAVRQRGGPATG